jgi:hypothetical protein
MRRGSHPIELLSHYATQVAAGSEFEFGLYTHRPGLVRDAREVIRIAGASARSWFFRELPSAEQTSREIALQSRVYSTDGTVRHIPMCDLTGIREVGEIRKVCNAMALFGSAHCYVFNSGKSYHVYGASLVASESFVPLAAALLLVNQSRRRPLVDDRWIAHRLLAGYYSLRLTRVNKPYHRGPIMIDELDGSIEQIPNEVTDSLRERNAFHI